MATRVPRHALIFMASSARLAAKHGLKKGLRRAAAKANPTLLAIEAAVSVVDAVSSYLNLRAAREHRDGLQKLIPYEEERLRLERQQLREQLDLAKEAIEQREDIQRRIGELALACSRVCRTTWDELEAIRSSELPDLEAFDSQLQSLENAWTDFCHVLKNYNETSVQTEE